MSTYSILQQSNIIVEDNTETSLPVTVQVATNTLSVTLSSSIDQETSLELKIDGVDIPGVGGLTDSLGITIKDSTGNLKDRVTSGLRFQIKCTSMASVRVSDEIMGSMTMPGLDYDHGSGVGYHFQVPINADPKQINRVRGNISSGVRKYLKGSLRWSSRYTCQRAKCNGRHANDNIKRITTLR